MNQVSALFWFFDIMDKYGWLATGVAVGFAAGFAIGFLIGFVLAGVYYRRKQCEVSGQ
jgi:uncharacterized membrane protein (DUF485 family)